MQKRVYALILLNHNFIRFLRENLVRFCQKIVQNSLFGKLINDSNEGELDWIKIEDLEKIEQFDQNKIFTPYLFKSELFEGKFILDDSHKVLKYKISK